MRPATLFAFALLGATFAGMARGESPALAPIVTLPGHAQPCRLRLEITTDGQSPAAAWDQFLDRLFDFFDCDQGGTLSQDECSRMMPLPLPERREITIEFQILDSDKSGAVSRAEFKAHCHERGFTPVVVRTVPPTTEDQGLSALFRENLDVNGNGRYTAEELRQAPRLLRRFDFNEDECLDLAELAGHAAVLPAPDKTQAAAVLGNGESDVTVQVNFKANAPAVSVAQNANGFLTAIDPIATGNRYRWRGPGNLWTLSLEPRCTQPNIQSAGEFLIAQFRTVLGDRLELSRGDLKQDATLSGLIELAPFADRNGDDRLSMIELQDYVSLVAAALQSQVWVHVIDHGHNLFSLLDGDADGRLSYSELAQASSVIGAENVSVAELPRQFEITFVAAPVRSWGGMLIPSIARRPQSVTKEAPSGPRWFQVMDRNSDGIVSQLEFLGPPEVFRRLDANSDGTISRAEAAEAAASVK